MLYINWYINVYAQKYMHILICRITDVVIGTLLAAAGCVPAAVAICRQDPQICEILNHSQGSWYAMVVLEDSERFTDFMLL